MEITVLIHCHTMPGSAFGDCRDITLGVQRGKLVEQEAPGDSPEVTFSMQLRVGNSPGPAQPNFLGPYAQGSAAERFVYLVWSQGVGPFRRMFRRAKVPLGAIGWELVSEAVETGKPIRVSLGMTGPKGDPRCASIKLTAADWSLG